MAWGSSPSGARRVVRYCTEPGMMRARVRPGRRDACPSAGGVPTAGCSGSSAATAVVLSAVCSASASGGAERLRGDLLLAFMRGSCGIARGSRLLRSEFAR